MIEVIHTELYHDELHSEKKHSILNRRRQHPNCDTFGLSTTYLSSCHCQPLLRRVAMARTILSTTVLTGFSHSISGGVQRQIQHLYQHLARTWLADRNGGELEIAALRHALRARDQLELTVIDCAHSFQPTLPQPVRRRSPGAAIPTLRGVARFTSNAPDPSSNRFRTPCKLWPPNRRW